MGAYAYVAPGSAAGGSEQLPTISFDQLLGPAQSFFQNLRSYSDSGGSYQAPSFNLVTVGPGGLLDPSSPLVANGVRNAFEQLDQWLYGILGFHFLGFFTAILAVFSWVLGAIKGVVDWLVGLL